MGRRQLLWGSLGVVALAGVGVSGWLIGRRTPPTPIVVESPASYTRDGFGGIVSVPVRKNPVAPVPSAITGKSVPVSTPVSVASDPVAPARVALAQRRYPAALAEARKTIASTPPNTPTRRKARLTARKIEAFVLARQGDLKGAQQVFATLASEGARFSEGNIRPAVAPGEWERPTLREDALYQHAILTAAQGDKPAAEREFNAFLQKFPESPLMIAAVKRVSRFHDQNIPKETEALWKAAMDTRAKRDKEARRVAALCGPKCLAELLRRRSPQPPINAPRPPVLGGNSEDGVVERIARSMKTDEDGTSLLALRDEARRQGFSQAEGVRLTAIGLKAQKLPLIALIMPGHFVLVDRVDEKKVTLWDPALGKSRAVSWEKWAEQSMGGVALTLGGAAVKTASLPPPASPPTPPAVSLGRKATFNVASTSGRRGIYEAFCAFGILKD